MAHKGVFFDLYGTLLIYGDMDAAWHDWFEVLFESLRQHGLPLEKDAFRRECSGFFGWPEPPVVDDGLTVFERRIHAFCRKLDLILTPDQVRPVATASVEAWQEYVTLDPEAADVLQRVCVDHTLALISNFDHPPHVHGVLRRFGLTSLFDSIVVSAEQGIKKPDPAIFEPALEQTGLAAVDVMYVGDAPEDVSAAMAAGMTPVLLRRAGAREVHTVTDFRPEITDSNGPPAERSPAVTTISRLSDLFDVLT
ncbi:MAG: HAD family hydrolase [candidate division Zixibacteria bacterium]|nr:HAD family hydrolase [candidate division Zixibacteria bacterium]